MLSKTPFPQCLHCLFSILVFCAAFIIFNIPSATAHHPTSGFALSSAAPQQLLELENSWARYPSALDPAGAGRWQQVRLRVEQILGERASVALSLPYASLESATQSTSGLGDIEISGKLSLWQAAESIDHLSVGLGLELPTGDAHSGVGGGHMELGPFISYQTQLHSRWVAFGRVNALLLLDAHHHHHGDEGLSAGSLIAPHEDREAQLSLGLVFNERSWYLSGALESGLLFPDKFELGPQIVNAEIGFRPSQILRFALSYLHPFAGQQRIDGQLRLGVSYWFGAAPAVISDSPPAVTSESPPAVN